MIDDILTVTNVENTQSMNENINTFMEHKRLTLSHNKCFRIHIGNNHDKCPEMKVHEKIMKESKKEKYLGDLIESKGNLQATIDRRISKGNGIISEIMAILEEFPLGQHKTDVALKLREAMLLNGILFNSESWHGLTKKQIDSLESVDEYLLRNILKAHSKTPKEFLYLELGVLPLQWVISQRRITYLKHIISRKDNDLVKKV